MRLKDLLRDVPVIWMRADPETEILHIARDSRFVRPGGMFVAVAGYQTDGNRYVSQALAKGMRVLVTASEPELDIPYVLVKSDRLAMALISRNYYGDPASAMKLAGITGTNGKTSSAMLLKHVLEKTADGKVGLISTVENRIGGLKLPAERTTPESLELQEMLARMRGAGCQYAVMEVSSHAIALQRVAGIRYDVAAFTNLTEDHLDFHGTMENYCDTKAELFACCRRAVVSIDSPWYKRILQKCTCPVITAGICGRGELKADGVRLFPEGVQFTAAYRDQKSSVKLGIPGLFTVSNALTAIGTAIQLGVPFADAAAALESARGIRGRLETVPTPGMPFSVLIDYAHTPDGLQKVLETVKQFCKGRLITVFGCGGNRDPVKRPIMGKIGTEIADWVILTSDNPRQEEPGKIIQEIQKGADPRKNNYEIMENRPDAICHAMDIAKKNDIIVLVGKGHETYQEICGVKYPMDERQIVAAHLVEMR